MIYMIVFAVIEIAGMIVYAKILSPTYRDAHWRTNKTHVSPLHFPPSRIWALKTMMDP